MLPQGVAESSAGQVSVPFGAEGPPEGFLVQFAVEVAQDQQPAAFRPDQERVGHLGEPCGGPDAVLPVVELRGEVADEQPRRVAYQLALHVEEFAGGARGDPAYLAGEELVALVEQGEADAAPVGGGPVDEAVVVVQGFRQVANGPFALHLGERYHVESGIVYRPGDAVELRPVAFGIPAVTSRGGEVAVGVERTGDGVEQVFDVVEGHRHLPVLRCGRREGQKRAEQHQRQ